MQDLNLVLRLKADGSGFVTEVRQSGQAVQQLGDKGRVAAAKLKTTEHQMDVVERSAASLYSGLLAVAGGFSALAVAGDITRTLAQYQDMRTQITALVGSQQQWLETEQYLIGIAAEHNKVLTDMAAHYARLATLQEAGLLTQGEMRAVFEGMSNVQSQTGATADQLGQAMYGLSQALASPVVRAEELNQVVEPLPGLLNKLDKAAGLPAGGFRQLMLAGKVTSELFKNTLVRALGDYEGAAARLAGNINAQMANVKNAYQQAVVAFERPVSDGLSAVFGPLASGLSALAEHADTVATVFGVTLAAGLGRATTAIGSYAQQQLAAIAASRAQQTASVAATAAAITAAHAEERKALSQRAAASTAEQVKAADMRLAAARNALAAANNTAAITGRNATAVTLAAARAEEQKALALKAGALTSAQAQIADARLSAARTTLAAATNTATVASRAFSGAMALAGGPAGVVMMAAGALAYFAMQADDATVDTRGLKNEVDALLGRMDKLEESRLTSAIEKQKASVDQLRSEYNRLAHAPLPGQTLWQQVTESNSEMRARQKAEAQETADLIHKINRQLIPAEQDLAALEQRLANLRAGKAAEVTDSPGGSKPPISASTTADTAAQKLLTKLQQQTALYGQTSEAAKVLYDIEHGALRGVNATLHQQLLAEAEKLDLLNAQTRALQVQDAARQQLDGLRRQSALGSDATQTQQVRYEIDHGALQGVDGGLQQQLLETAALLDRQKADQKVLAFEEEVAQLTEQHEVLRAMALSEFEAQRVQAQQAHAQQVDTLTTQFEELHALYAGDQETRRSLEQQYLDGREALHASHQATLTDIERAEENKRNQLQQQQLQNYGSLFDAMAGIAEGFAGEQSGIYRGLFAVSKAFAVAESVIKIQQGIAAAASLPFPSNIPAMATVAAQTASIVSTIQGTQFQGQAHDGIDRVPTSNEGTWLLKQDEMVLNPAQADSFRWMVTIMQQMARSVGSAGGQKGATDAQAAMSLLVRFEGLPEGYSASTALSDGEIVALVQKSSRETETRTYNRVARDMLDRSNLVGQAMR